MRPCRLELPSSSASSVGWSCVALHFLAKVQSALPSFVVYVILSMLKKQEAHAHGLLDMSLILPSFFLHDKHTHTNDRKLIEGRFETISRLQANPLQIFCYSVHLFGCSHLLADTPKELRNGYIILSVLFFFVWG